MRTLIRAQCVLCERLEPCLDGLEAFEKLFAVIEVRNVVRVAAKGDQLVVGGHLLDIAQVELYAVLIGETRGDCACGARCPVIQNRFFHDRS